MKRDRYYKTTNFNLCVFLYAQGHIISGVNPLNRNQKEFSFIKTPSIEELIDIYKFGDSDDDRLLVQVHRYETARRHLLDRLND